MKTIILTTIIVAVISAAAWFGFVHPVNEARINTVIQVLKLLPINQLVVLKEERLIRVEYDDSGLLLGRRKGHVSLIVNVNWAVDLRRLKPSDIRVMGRHVTVTLPPVECFDTAPVLKSWAFYGNKSGLFYIADALRGRQLRDDLFAAVAQSLDAYRYSDGSKFRPEIVERLNKQAATLFVGTGLEVRFK